MSPPINPDPTTSAHLMKYLHAGHLNTVATDNCTFCLAQKKLGEKDFSKIPNGVCGIEDRLSVLWTKAVDNGFLSPMDFVKVTSTAAAQIFNMYPNKGIIKAGADADVVVWNPKADKVISA
jgi:dihydropyrimidinase